MAAVAAVAAATEAAGKTPHIELKTPPPRRGFLLVVRPCFGGQLRLEEGAASTSSATMRSASRTSEVFGHRLGPVLVNGGSDETPLQRSSGVSSSFLPLTWQGLGSRVEVLQEAC